MSKHFIKKKIYLSCDKLNHNISQNIVEKIKSMYLEKCDSEHGYITKIYDQIKITNNIVSTVDSGVFFDVDILVESFKPEINNEYEGVVCLAFAGGLFVDVTNSAKILVTKDTIEDSGFVFNTNDSVYKNDQNVTIKKNTRIRLSITKINYENSRFKCIGKFKSICCENLKEKEKDKNVI